MLVWVVVVDSIADVFSVSLYSTTTEVRTGFIPVVVIASNNMPTSSDETSSASSI